MSSSATAQWGEDDRADVASAAELDALLDRLDAAARADGDPQLVTLTASGEAGTLAIVVGHDRSVVSHVPADGDPPYRVSVGEQDEPGVFTYFMAGGHHSEALWRETVPAAAARAAARTFLTTGALDDRVGWEET